MWHHVFYTKDYALKRKRVCGGIRLFILPILSLSSTDSHFHCSWLIHGRGWSSWTSFTRINGKRYGVRWMIKPYMALHSSKPLTTWCCLTDMFNFTVEVIKWIKDNLRLRHCTHQTAATEGRGNACLNRLKDFWSLQLKKIFHYFKIEAEVVLNFSL